MKTIQKTSYIIIGSSLLLASCQQTDMPTVIPEGSDRRIVFRTSLPELTTKASEIAKDLDYFRMTAFDMSDPHKITDGVLDIYSEDIRIEKNQNDERYSSDLCVWPDPGKEDDLLHFFAYYPELPEDAVLKNRSTATGDTPSIDYRIENYAIASDIADQVDFVTAHTTGTMTDNYFSGISLDFRHQLCRVEVLAKGAHKSCDVEIAGVAIGSTPMDGTFEFAMGDTDGVWSQTVKRNATYIFREGDEIVTVGAEPVSIMGKTIGTEENCAMLIPSTASAWDYSKDIHNANKGLFLNVLLRIIDKTPTGKGKQQYPYYDNSQGLNALDIPLVLFTVDNNATIIDGPVQVYKDVDGKYYTDKEKTTEYTVPQGIVVKEFGWAAVPISGDWQPGYVNTYTLDYTYGVGVHGPETPGDVAPKAGDPIISDRVGVSMSVKGWQNAGNTGISVPGN